MSIDYQLVILDDMDWGYKDYSLVEVLQNICWYYEITNALTGMVAVDIGNTWPTTALEWMEEDGLVWDNVYVRAMPSAELTPIEDYK